VPGRTDPAGARPRPFGSGAKDYRDGRDSARSELRPDRERRDHHRRRATPGTDRGDRTNVPVCATALIFFAVLYLQFSVFLLPTLAITLGAMAVVLAAQVLRLRAHSGTQGEPESGDMDVQRREARAKAQRSALIDESISVVFIGVSWGIFAELAPADAQVLGPGWTFPSRGWRAVPQAEVVGVLVTIGLLTLAVALLWRRYALDSARSKMAEFRPLMIEPVPPGEAVTCEFADGYRYAVAEGPPPASDHPNVHSGDVRYFTLLSRQGTLPQRFAICRSHSTVFVRLEAWGRKIVARS
jgi:hypothetical protein